MTERPGDDEKQVPLAERWHAAVTAAHVSPMTRAESRQLLERLAGELDAAAESTDGQPERVHALGRDLARAGFIGDDVLGASLAVLGRHFTDVVPVVASRRNDLLGAFATGYVTAFRAWLLGEQEQIRVAESAVRRDAAAPDDESPNGEPAAAGPEPDLERPARPDESRLADVFAQAGAGLALVDLTGTIIQVNTAFTDLLGYPPDALVGTSTLAELSHPDDDPRLPGVYESVLRGETGHVRLEKPFRHADGHTVWTDLDLTVVRDRERVPQLGVLSIGDISHRRELAQDLRYRAQHDELTGLATRNRFHEALAEALADPSARVGLLYVDLDHFKGINDRLGHAVGDQLLVAAADRLRDCAGPGRVVARMGGDEFVVLLPKVDHDGQVAELAGLVLAAFAGPFQLADHRLRVGASIGVTEQDAGRTSADELLWSADSSMYWAKSDGRDRFVAFDPARSRTEHSRAELAAAIPDALAHGEFVVFYQPIVRLTDRAIVAVEALVRWQHPRLGLLPPAKFLDPNADVAHLAALDAWVLDRACRDQRRWYEEQPQHAPMVSVNVAASDVADPGWADRVHAIIADTGVRPDRLQLELTERAFTDLTDQLLKALYRLAGLGVHIAIDDFGSGSSNLPALAQLPLHTVKLAGPMIERVGGAEQDNRRELVIVEAMVRLAHTLGFAITAARVESPAQARQLHGIGCDTAQGWYFHQPKPAEVVGQLLRRSAGLSDPTRV